MIQTGLVSVTFRDLSAREIVDLVTEGGLAAIEWGGDVHVPHGDIDTARAVGQMTDDAGLIVPSYGSYYRVGHGEPVAFELVVETAMALGAPLVRVWAGKRGTAAAEPAYWERVVSDAARCADLASAAGLDIAFEYHANTLTDNDADAVRLLQAIDHKAVSTYWQMRGQGSTANHEASLRSILPWLSHIHIQSYRNADGGRRRAPLAAMAATWRRLLRIAAGAPGDHVAMIEFVAGDTPQQLLADAAALQTLIAQIDA